ncbi:MAG: hypothetical protein H6745_24715 [Deltaproteobacteria bacterium]|nr:hypothetical protein [Deltaproteobacteria bacterium]
MTRRVTSRAALVAVALSVVTAAGGCGTAELATDRDALYNQSVDALGSGEPVLAMRAANRYLKGATVDDARYDRALRVIARGAETLGLRYAASIAWLGIAEGRRDPELVPDAVAAIARLVTTGPHDDRLLVGGFVAAADLGQLPPDLAGFVAYEAGLDLLRRGYGEWAATRFSTIPAASPWAYRARYVQATVLVAAGALADAQAAFEGLLADGDDPEKQALGARLPDDLRVDLHRSIARLLFEAKRYDEALVHYDAIRDRAKDDPGLLLEMAWAHYHRGATVRALGLVLALDAPEFSDLIAPERYLLAALCFRRLCQFEPARAAAVRLESEYADAYRDLASGRPLTASQPLRDAARRLREVRPTAELLASMKAERARVAGLADELGPDLLAYLAGVYDRGLEEVGRREEEALRVAVVKVGNQLLSAREGVRLTTHELGVALLRGRHRPAGPRELPPPETSARGDHVAFEFTGEFWTDELDDLVVRVEDQCIQ